MPQGLRGGGALKAFTDAYEKTRPPPREKPRGTDFGVPVTDPEDPPWVRWRFENDDWDDLNDQDPLVMAVHEEILLWGKRWNLSWVKRRKLTNPWLLDVALQSLRSWHQDPKYLLMVEDPEGVEGQSVKGRFVDPGFIDSDDVAELVLPAWHPMWRSRSAYKEMALRKLDEYLDATEAWAKSQGMKPGVKKRGADVVKHFKWLAHHQVLEKSYETIAKEFRVKQDAVAHAVRKAAKLIDLKLRVVGPGMRDK